MNILPTELKLDPRLSYIKELHIHIAGPQSFDLSKLTRLNSLNKLCLSNALSPLKNLDPFLEKNRKLQVLKFRRCYAIDADSFPLMALGSLQKLTLDQSLQRVTAEFLRKLFKQTPSLQTLSLKSCFLLSLDEVEKFFKEFDRSTLSQLRTLKIDNVPIKKKTLLHLSKKLPDLKIVQKATFNQSKKRRIN